MLQTPEQLAAAAYQAGLIMGIIISILMFIIGIFITRWYADKKGWDDSLKSAVILSVIWFLLDLGMDLLFNIMGLGLVGDLIVLVISVFIGAIVAMKVYDKDFGESLVFVIVILILEFIVGFIIGFILGLVLASVLIAMLL
jgi:hypothetical protein